MTMNEDELSQNSNAADASAEPARVEQDTPVAVESTAQPADAGVPEDTASYDGTSLDADQQIDKQPVAVKRTAPVNSGDEVPKDRPEDYARYELPSGPNPHVAPSQPVFADTTDERQLNDPLHVTALPCDVEALNSLLEAYPSINYEVGETNREWAAEIQAGASLLWQGNFLSKVVSREGAMWSQRVPYGANTLGIVRPKLGNAGAPGTNISGELASLRVRQTLGMGVPTAVPLFHSGIWVSLKAPSAAARLELQRRIDSEKVQLGRMTTGMAYSNVSVYIKSYLADFCLAHVSTANVKYDQTQDLKNLILATDIPTLIWAILTTVYPNGYPYHQPCMNDPSRCQHVVRQVIDINKIHFTALERLTDAQLKHMSRRSEKVELRDIEAYRAAHSYNSKGKITLKVQHGSITVQLKVPTVTEYASAGFNWVDGITNDIQRAFGSELTGARRNEYILERAKATSMCEYSHWIKEIGLSDGSSIVDVDTIRQTLGELGGEPELADDFFQQIVNYIEDTTLSIVALPRFDCPACGKPTTADEKNHPYLNPIDVEALFFMMLGQHIAKALM
jgi:hypothetical protein